MIDILNFKKKSYHLDLDSNTVMVNIPLSVKVFRDVLSSYRKKDDGLKALAYVANSAHYGSPANLSGTTGNEKREDIFINLDIPEDFKFTKEVTLAIKYFENHYNKGIYGLFKELNKSYEMTRETISVLNSSLKIVIRDVQKKAAAIESGKVNTDNEGDTSTGLLDSIDTINKAISKVRELTSGLGSDIESLKKLEEILVSEESMLEDIYGGGTVPDSAKVSEN